MDIPNGIVELIARLGGGRSSLREGDEVIDVGFAAGCWGERQFLSLGVVESITNGNALIRIVRDLNIDGSVTDRSDRCSCAVDYLLEPFGEKLKCYREFCQRLERECDQR